MLQKQINNWKSYVCLDGLQSQQNGNLFCCVSHRKCFFEKLYQVFNYIFQTVIANILLINSTVLFYSSPCYMLMINTIQMPVIQNFKRNVILRKNSHMKTTTALFSSFFNYIFNFAGKKTTLAYHLMVILSSLSFMFEFKYPVPSICDILSQSKREKFKM